MSCTRGAAAPEPGVPRWHVSWARLAVPLLLLAAAPALAAPAADGPAPPAEDRAVDRWSEEEGVPGVVTALLRTDDGYLWVGTRRGLVRFDGIRFSRIPLTDGKAELNVRALLEAADGGVWVGSDGGLARWLEGQVTRLDAGGRAVHALLRARDGTLWAATDTGVALVHADHLEPLPGAAPGLTALAEDAAGRLLAGAEDGLYTVAGGRLQRLPPAEGGMSKVVRALLTDRRGRTWVGTTEGLLRADPEGLAARRPFGEGLASAAVTALAEDREGRLWAASVAGSVQRLSPDGSTAAPREADLPTRPTTTLLADRDGALWAGSGAGLVRLRPRLVLAFTRASGLSAEVVWSVYADPQDGALWLGVDGPGLDRLAGGRVTPFGPRWGLEAATVSATLRTREGDLWISLRSGGLARSRGGRPTPVLDADGAPYLRARGLTQASDGSVWVGTERGLERHLGGRAGRVPVSRGWPFRVIIEDPRGDLWAGGSALVRLVGPGRREETPAPLEDVGNVMSLLPDGDDLWIASYAAGLQLWHAGRLTTFAHLDPRFAGRAVAVLADGQGGLWVALEGALVLARQQELLELAEGRRATLRLQVFDERDGMPSTEFTAAGQSSAARTPDGRLWFGTVAGLVVVDPARLAQAGLPAAPRVERAFVGGAEARLDGGPLRLDRGDATLELHFTSPTLVSPHRLAFRHRLVGLEPEWQASSPQRTALYRGLGEGDYRLELEVSRDGADWVPAASPLEVTVRPGLLERPWFRAGLAALTLATLALAALAVARLRGRRLRARARELGRLVQERTQELAAARDELEARVEERTGQLQRELAERERLERELFDAQKLDSIGRLAGGVAHDLNNLLTVVLGCAATAQLPDASPEEVREDLGEIQKAGDRAAALTRQLLAFARRQILSSRRLDLNDVVAGVGTLLRRLIGAHIELVTDVAAEPCPVLADPGQLEQVLVNLAVNARDAMPGGGTLRVETAPVVLEKDLGGARPGVAAGAWVRLRVSDTGTGLSEEAARHLFEPFFTTKEKGKGTGLGLATCYGIVKQMGGHIWLRSEPGRGTTVEIHLPRAEGAVERPSVEGATAAPPASDGGERILVVEDEPQVRALAARALAERGYQVLTAGDGEEALRVLEEERRPFDLLLTDVVMPRMGGVELVARLTARSPETAVLFMSGYVEQAEVGQGALPARADVLLKPFTPAMLSARVRAALDAP